MPAKTANVEAAPIKFDRAEWRLVHHGLSDGPSNMAIDEAILDAVASGESQPTIRFYGWDPACVSLGYGQKSQIIDNKFLAKSGWDLVRRPTGGRAILHVDELTYSICAPVTEPRVRGSVLESYQQLSGALLSGLRNMGLSPAKSIPDPDLSQEIGPACFDGPSNYEITVDGRKLVGSAQVRKHGVVLQHGTIPLYGDVTRLSKALYFDRRSKRDALAILLQRQAITLESALGRRIGFAEAANYMAQGMAGTLNLELIEADLTETETIRAATLLSEKYNHKDWTHRR
jgi:lipoate-protein ligase A